MEQAAALIAVGQVQQQGTVAHRTGQHVVHRYAVHGFGEGGPPGGTPAAGLETEQATAGRRDTNAATTVIGTGHWHDTRRHHGRRPPGGTTGGMIQIPGVTGRAIGVRLGNSLGAKLGSVGPPERHQPGGFPARHQGGIPVRADVVFLARLVALIAGCTGHFLEQVFHQHGHPGQRTLQRCGGPFPGLFVEGNNQRIQGRIHLLRPGDGRVQQLSGAHLSPGHQLRQPHGIKLTIFLKLHACALPKAFDFFATVARRQVTYCGIVCPAKWAKACVFTL